MRQQLPPRPSVFDHHDLCEVFAKRLVTSEFKSVPSISVGKRSLIWMHYVSSLLPPSKPNIHHIHPCWHRHRSVTSLLTSSVESLMLAMTPETSIRSFLKFSQHRCDSPWICKVCGDCCYSKLAIDQQCAFINASKPSCVALISSNRGEKSRLLCRWLISAKMSPNWLCISSFTFTS